jgi:hypothetical protein
MIGSQRREAGSQYVEQHSPLFVQDTAILLNEINACWARKGTQPLQMEGAGG